MPPDPTPRSLRLWVYTKSLSGLHISSACLDPCPLQRLAKRKQKKQVELDKCAFDPEHMEEPHNGGSFPMVNIPQLSRSYGKYLSNSTFLWWIFPNFHVPMVNIFQNYGPPTHLYILFDFLCLRSTGNFPFDLSDPLFKLYAFHPPEEKSRTDSTMLWHQRKMTPTPFMKCRTR